MNKLFKLPGALPYLAVVLLNAFVDLGHKITIQNTVFKVYDGNTQIILSAIINGLILLPFILLFSPAGYISDRFAKNQVMRVAAWAAVVVTLGITACYYLGWFWPAFALTFLLAIQSAIYSPAKYGYIKLLFGKEHLAEANGLVQAITIGAILLGTLAFSMLFESWFPVGSTANEGLKVIAPIGWILVANSILECVMAYRLPNLDAIGETNTLNAEGFSTAKGFSKAEGSFLAKGSSIAKGSFLAKGSFNKRDYLSGRSLKTNIQPVTRNRVIRLSVIGLAVFWSVGQVMLAAFPAFAKETLAVTNTVVIQGILAATGIGIAVGSTLAGKWSKGYVETGLIPVGAIGISLGLMLLPQLNSITTLFIDFLFIGLAGGLFIVPLNALIQFSARDHELGKVLAGNNLIQNISMLGFLILTVAFALAGISSQWLLSIIAGVALVGGLYTVYQLPQSLIRILLTMVMTRRYKVDVQGVKNLPSTGGVLLLGNHISWIDWAIVQIASPRPIRFVMLKSVYQRWYLTGFLKLLGCIPIEAGASSKKSLQTVAELLDKGEVVCLFPEGAISRNGHLGEFRRGFEHACELTTTDISIVPFYLRGLWGSQFSRSSEKLRSLRSSGLSRDIIVSFGPALPKDTSVDVLKRRVFDLSIQSWQQHVNELPTLPQAWIKTVKRVGSELSIADTLGDPLSATQSLVAAIAFSKRINTISQENTIGLLLPTSAGGVLANMATLLLNKTVVNLNYSSSPEAIASAIQQAEIKTVYTSQKFLEKLQRKGINVVSALQSSKIIFMEDIKADMSKLEMLRLWLTVRCLPAWCLQSLYCKSKNADNTAAILFSSGSEGAPKGVMLSHRNIMANLKQISDVLNTQDEDVVMASLPLFHAFGLTVTQFMPLIEGLPMVCHADPTDAVNISKAVAKYRATIMCGTSTFLRLFANNRKVHPLMLESLRIVVAGAEKLNEDVKTSFQQKFNKQLLEGYGATETTPVASVNLPDMLDTSYWKVQTGGRPGTVGMPLPGTSFKIIDPETEVELPTGEAGMILIGGSQVMQGYLKNPEKTAEVIREIDGQRWYVTGDKGSIDPDGFLTIIDRYSRFAKIGGEMVSLSTVEQQAEQAISNLTLSTDKAIELVATTIPDPKKGEAIILLCTENIETAVLREQLLAAECNALTIPSQCVQVESIPKLGSGKTDFKQAREFK